MSENMINEDCLVWIRFYMEFADKLRQYAENRQALIEIIKSVYAVTGIKMPMLEKDNSIFDIDPFTVFGLFNKGITNANRIRIIKAFAEEFSLRASVPETFDGVPVLNNLNATYYSFIDQRGDNDIDDLWGVFLSALNYANTHSPENRAEFIRYYDLTSRAKGVKWKLTMGLYWIRPYEFINLDSRNRWYIRNPENMPVEFVQLVGKLDDIPSGEEYLSIIDVGKKVLTQNLYPYTNFPELSYHAWIISEKVNEAERVVENRTLRENVAEAIGDSNVNTVHYWIYTPGYGAEKWDEFYNEGIMGIAREYIGDLRQYKTQKEMQRAMVNFRDDNPGFDSGATSYRSTSLETWQFLYELKPGDIIFAKEGKRKLIGRGVVLSDYIYDEGRADRYKNIRKVKWTHKGEWEHPGNAITKVLTDVTSYTEYIEKLSALFTDEAQNEMEEPEHSFPAYTREDFLSEVYLNETSYDELTGLLRNKKNLILQGAPGVGKTYAAKRLAYSIMGVKDPDRVMMIQFHQSYSYEDFIMGFRPSSAGFELRKGPFYNFCKKAEIDRENEYFFIIDEINRGNLSKIFGELFMLIEKDKREIPLQLLYSDEKFSVPANVYIIGMMNTADRSLAMLDYALRRRFAFFEFVPAFTSEGFRNYRQGKNNEKFNNFIAAVEKLNNAIENDDTLGKGFRIGHSYFCTEKEIDDRWIHAVIAYEIIPLLNEYWFDEPNKVRDWESTLHEAVR